MDKKNKTYTAGANAERTAILAHVRRLVKPRENLGAIDGDKLIAWLLGRNERYNKRTKGVGK